MRFIFALCLFATATQADPVMIDDFTGTAKPWRFFTDQVMGGVSTGQARITDGALHLTGDVSTANNGGFVQARLEGLALPEDATGLTITARGDGQVYYIHLRTTGTRLPWQYYQAAFTAPRDWADITLPLAAFRPSGSLLRATPRAQDIRSVALVAYGRDHAADVRLSRIVAEVP
ncbi:CIA30 family protein [Thalassococcus sp. CAU 1522]|uniref:CIA30 family protein n=1 Tax=Thalassococcus arenae TaxID=2851652 RepID=A0ABS6N536_9RHOB|nr:CIA30 family protein [Thalassococcus arenae]MBV2358719.1 CIA30 family protein [Thalassococcus arenae]